MQRLVTPLFDMARPSRVLVLAVPLAASLTATTALAQTSSFQPAAPQPVLPASGGPKPTSPVLERLMGDKAPVLDVHKTYHRRHEARSSHRHLARAVPDALDRPSLAGVILLHALPRPGEPPHVSVPLPAYSLDSIVTATTVPAPPIVCHPTRREPGLPDPHLYRERTVLCEADNP